MNIKEKRIASWLLVVTRTKTEKRRWTPDSCNSLFAVVLADTTNVGHFPVYKKEKIYIDIYIYIMQVMGWGKGVGSIESA